MVVPSIQAVMRIRYAAMVVVRIVAVVLAAIAAIQIWTLASAILLPTLFGLAGGLDVIRIVADLIIGPGAYLVGAAALLRFGPQLTRWLAPLPQRGCPECGYPVSRSRGGRCPECGTRLPDDAAA